MAEGSDGDHPISHLRHGAFSACRSLSSTSPSRRLCTTQEPFFCSHPLSFFGVYILEILAGCYHLPLALLQQKQAAASP